MTRLLLKLPWFVSTPVIVAFALILAAGGNNLLGDYFERTFLDEADPLAAAQPSQPSSSQPAASPAADSATDTGVLQLGEFRDGDPGHNGSGQAKVIQTADGELVLRFENFSVTGGPDLFVILSADPEGSRSSAQDGLDLGDLKATDGNVNYSIPQGTDVSQFSSVIIYCRSFNIVFAVATLEPPS